MPFFSVLIPAFNRQEMLRSAIDSVLFQTFSDYEIIVIDDGSTDGTEILAEHYGSRIKYLRQENSGVSSARNAGIIKSCAPYIALLDSDDTWHPAKLREHREYIAANPLTLIHQTEDIWYRNGRRVNPMKKHLKPEGELFRASLELCMISPSSVVISRELFDRYGLFDEELPVCEDYDLWLRITPFENVGLIRKKLITRFSGHGGQLSASHHPLDRFRLYSILKLIEDSGSSLSVSDLQAAVESARKRMDILLTGAEKRGNSAMADAVRRIRDIMECGYCRRKDYRILLEI